MRRLLHVLLALVLACTGAADAQMLQAVTSSNSLGPPALDGTSKQGTGTTFTFTTTHPGSVLVLAISMCFGTINSITTAGVVWAERGTQQGDGTCNGQIQLWYGKIAGVLTAATTTLSLSGQSGVAWVAGAFTNINYAAPFDPDASIPIYQAAGGAANCTFTPITTTNSNDVLLVAAGAGGAYVKPTGFTNFLSPANSIAFSYQIVSSRQAAATIASTGANCYYGQFDALQN